MDFRVTVTMDKRNIALLTAVMAIQDYCRNRLIKGADSSFNVHIFPTCWHTEE